MQNFDDKEIEELLVRENYVSDADIEEAEANAEDSHKRVLDYLLEKELITKDLLGQESGLDFVAKLKEADSTSRNIPIYVVSNTASPDKVQTYLQLGVTKYFVKARHKLEKIITEIQENIEEAEKKEKTEE